MAHGLLKWGDGCPDGPPLDWRASRRCDMDFRRWAHHRGPEWVSVPSVRGSQMPIGAERDRSSVGGALKLSGTGVRFGWPADFSCEHPVGGPCASGPMRVRHADQRSAGNRWGFIPADQTNTALAVPSANMVHSQGAHRAFVAPQLGGRACRIAPQSRHAALGSPPDRSSVTTRRAVCAQIRLEKRRTVIGGPLELNRGDSSSGPVRVAGGATRTGRCYLARSVRVSRRWPSLVGRYGCIVTMPSARN